MNPRLFFDRVVMLRKFQKDYFATRDKTVLQQAKALEKEIDDEIARVQSILSIES
ncbi:MAG: hypothetical protein NC411_10620 [Bacteroides sp.]|nr:hypothetical protein [Bacteroides sp.]